MQLWVFFGWAIFSTCWIVGVVLYCSNSVRVTALARVVMSLLVCAVQLRVPRLGLPREERLARLHRWVDRFGDCQFAELAVVPSSRLVCAADNKYCCPCSEKYSRPKQAQPAGAPAAVVRVLLLRLPFARHCSTGWPRAVQNMV